MKKVLALDLGITTGWCVRFLNGDLKAFGTLTFPDREKFAYLCEEMFEKALTELVVRYLPSYVVIEPPLMLGRGGLQHDLQAVVGVTKKVIRQGQTIVDPNEWKQKYGKAKLPPQFRGSTTHEKDAYRISEFWLKTTGALL